MLQEFIRETKHRARDCETQEDVEHITRKLLCTLVPKFVDWQRVYHFVDSDLDGINFRAPSVLSNYADYKYFDPEWLDQLVSDNQQIKNNETLAHYTDAMKPIPVGKELYVFFLHGQKQKNLGEHLEYLFPDNTQERTRLSQLIHAYEPTLDEDILLQDVGTLLKNIQCSACKKHTEEKEEEEETQKKEETFTKSAIQRTHVPAKEWDMDGYKNPILETFRVNNNLSSRYPVEKVIKQVVISTVSPSIATDILKPIMGKYQNDVRLESPGSSIDDLLFIVDYYPDEVINAIVDNTSLREHTENTREYVKLLIKNHVAKNKELGSEIVKLLI